MVGIGPNRLTTAPLALKAHALLVLLAAFMVWDRHRPYSWVGIVLVAIVLWPLLRGSRLIWWVQVAAVVVALGRVYETQTHVSGIGVDLSTFVDGELLGALAVVLAVAGVLLFLPSVRSDLDRDPRLGRIGLVVGVVLIASFPTMGLAVDNRLPSTYQLGEIAGGTFLGSDPAHGIAYFATRRQTETCLVAVATHMHRPECHDADSLRWNQLGDNTVTADACVPRHFEVPPSVERRFCRMALVTPSRV